MKLNKRQKKIRTVVKNRQAGFVVVLEDIHDPHNAAAILRTCDAFGVQDVCFIFEKEKKYNPRKIGKSSSSSANKWLSFKVFNSTQDCLKVLKKTGYEIIATALTQKSKNLFKTKLLYNKIALLVGNEHRGLSDFAIKSADQILAIPMQGMVQSLNVSVTAGIFIYEIVRQRQKNINKYQLNPKSANKLERDFRKR
ncbi:MAG: RNA methyltransferase [Patescibacteria group bacterium]|jgi:tRNA (guanosine-2'-O-)-methyltransferase